VYENIGVFLLDDMKWSNYNKRNNFIQICIN